MSTIKPIDFARQAIESTREAGSRGKQVSILVDEMSQTTRANHIQTMTPSPIKHVIDAGAKGTQVKRVVEEMESTARAALNSKVPELASPVKRLNII